MENKIGVKETKEVLALGFALGKAGKAAYADKKIGFEDLAHLMAIFPSLQPAMEGMNLVPSEIKDLDSEEGKEILLFAGKELAGMFSSDAELVVKINAALEAGLAIVKLINVLK